ncbi:hypothetical protein ABZP36_000467 [Zizania latifolia]
MALHMALTSRSHMTAKQANKDWRAKLGGQRVAEAGEKYGRWRPSLAGEPCLGPPCASLQSCPNHAAPPRALVVARELSVDCGDVGETEGEGVIVVGAGVLEG